MQENPLTALIMDSMSELMILRKRNFLRKGHEPTPRRAQGCVQMHKQAQGNDLSP